MTDSDVLNTRIRELIQNREWAVLRELLSGLPAPDIAAVLPVTEKHERVLLFRLLPKHLAAEFFSYLEAKDKDML